MKLISICSVPNVFIRSIRIQVSKKDRRRSQYSPNALVVSLNLYNQLKGHAEQTIFPWTYYRPIVEWNLYVKNKFFIHLQKSNKSEEICGTRHNCICWNSACWLILTTICLVGFCLNEEQTTYIHFVHDLRRKYRIESNLSSQKNV